MSAHAQHSPLPWAVDVNNPGDVNGPDGKDIAVTLFAGMKAIQVTGNETTLSKITRASAEANATFIVRACNSHYKLVDALQRSLNWLSSYPGGGTLGESGPYEQARAALAEAAAE